MIESIPLTGLQKEIMQEFYASGPERIFLSKKQRNQLWKRAKESSIREKELLEIKEKCPAIYYQITQHDNDGLNIQSAVFSECVYAQALANIFCLNVFKNCNNDTSFLPTNVVKLLKSYFLKPRYAYVSSDGNRMLIQAGGCGGVDSALITVFNLKIFTIEFKEPYAKSCEHDLPEYSEDGVLIETKDFLNKYPQFVDMLKEQKDLNFFESIGHNINNFSFDSINRAIVDNSDYKKYADVLCTEDVKAQLVMLPINQIPIWSDIEGEIRPAGRNAYSVWTPLALRRYLNELGAIIDNDEVKVPLSKLKIACPRGGNGVSRYKINSLFFVRSKCVKKIGNYVSFKLSDVQQLRPTIAAKMCFKNLKYTTVKNHYFPNY